MWRAYTGVIHCVFGQILNQQIFALPPQTKRRRGGGLRQINTCRKLPLLVNFFKKPTFRVWCLYRYLVHESNPHRRGATPAAPPSPPPSPPSPVPPFACSFHASLGPLSNLASLLPAGLPTVLTSHCWLFFAQLIKGIVA